jgi:hypothetical protein
LDASALAAYDHRIASATPHIGTLNESSLHAALKARYAQPGDRFEVPLGGFVVDICRSNQLIEIQTSSFAAMANKLDQLLDDYRLLLVHPIAIETYLARPGRKPRKSPRRGSIYELFVELVSIPTLVDHPNLSIEVVLASVTRHQKPRSRGRRRYRNLDCELREVLGIHRFSGSAELGRLLPAGLPREFTTADIANGASVSRDLAQRVAYCLRALNRIAEVGRTRAGIRYRRVD